MNVLLRRLAALVLVLLSVAWVATAAAQPVEAEDPGKPSAAGSRWELENARVQLGAAEWIDRLTGVYALQRMGADAAPAAPSLVGALGDDNGLVRTESAEALFRIGDPAVPLLVPELSSPSVETRLLVAQTLGRIGLGAKPALPALQTAAESDDAAEVRDAAAFASTMIAPDGATGWLRKLAYEIGDEPYGIPLVVGGFVLLSVLGSVRSLVQSWRQSRAARARSAARATVLQSALSKVSRTSSTPGGVLADATSGEHASDGRAAHQRTEHEDDHELDDEGIEHTAADDDEDDDADEDEAAAPTRSGGSRAASGVGRLPAPQGVPHAIAGLIAMAVGVGIALLATFAGSHDVDERHGVYHFAGLFVLFGYLFVKIGFKGAWVERQARARALNTAEPWLRDRAWSRDGTGPTKAERVLPNLLALLLWVGFLTPFHTVWRLPFAYWGVWIVLGIFDVIAVVIAVAVTRRIWRRLRSGRAFLRWQSVPVRPGGTFNARFETARRLGAGQRITATLRCLRDRSENRVIGDEPAADADEIYADAKEFQVHDRAAGGSWAQLSFAVPEKARGTSSFGARPVRWVVTIALPIAGPDFRTTFPVPIYR